MQIEHLALNIKDARAFVRWYSEKTGHADTCRIRACADGGCRVCGLSR